MPNTPHSIAARLGLTTTLGIAKPRSVLRNTFLTALLAATAVAQTTPPTAAPAKPVIPPPPARTVPGPALRPTGSPATPAPASTATPVPAVPTSGPVPAPTPPPTGADLSAGVVAPLSPATPQLPGAAVPPGIPGRPALPANTARNAGGEQMEPLEFLNSDVKDVLFKYQQLTGVKLIYSTQLVGNIYISVRDVTKAEAVKIIELSLNINGFYITPVDGEEKLMRVTEIGRSPKSVGIPFIDTEAGLASIPVVNEQVVMYLMKLKWADPTEMSQIITQGLLSQSQGNYSSAVPLPKANAILITETTPFVRTIINFVKTVDVEPAEVTSLFITLQHAQAEDVVTNLEKLFEKTQTQTTSTSNAPQGIQPQGRFNRNQGNPNGQVNPNGQPIPGANTGGAPTPENLSIELTGGTGIGPTEDNIIIGKVKIAADKRTNRIHVVSRPVNLKFIQTLIKEYDADVPLPEPAVRALRYRAVDEVLDAVVAAIKDPGEKDSAGGPGGAALGQGARPGQTNQTNNTNQNRNTAGANSNSSLSGGSSDAGALGESLSTTEKSTVPIAQQVGKSTVIADPYSNTIIVVGTSDVKQKVLALLDKMDTEQAQVMVEVVIGELKLTKDENYGLDYILKNGPALNGTNNPIGSTGTGTGTGTTTTTTGIVGYNDTGSPVLNLNGLLNQKNITRALTAGSGGFSGFLSASNSFDVVLNLLESTNRFRVITKPSVFTSNNKRAVITSGEEVPVPTQITSGFTGNASNNLTSNSSIQFKPIELRLEVLPLINSQREVSLEVVQNVSERSGSTIIDNNAIPNVSRRAIKTYVTVPNRGTLILGGLIKESNDFTRSGIPVLSNLPWIGPLFGKTTKNKTRSELIVIMRPIVTKGPPETAALREETMQGFAIPPDFDQALAPTGLREKATVPKIIAPAPRETAPKLRPDVSATTTTTIRRR